VLSCKALSMLSDDYLENVLPFKKKASVLLHLAMCKNCRNYLKNLQTTVDLIGNNKTMPLESQKVDEIMRRIESESSTRK